MRPIIVAMCLLTIAPAVEPQTKPTQAELERWKAEGNTQVLESAPCKKVNWLLESQGKDSEFRRMVGWWGRGFVEGTVAMLDGPGGDAARAKVERFGLTVDVVAAHISAYCYAHPAETPWNAAGDLSLKALGAN